eukprot:4344960-Heterocapsa_arctica.AAC.1
MIQQRRLRYLPWLLSQAPRVLTALLQFRSPSGAMQPWSRLVLSDVVDVWGRSPKLADMPHPAVYFVIGAR